MLNKGTQQPLNHILNFMEKQKEVKDKIILLTLDIESAYTNVDHKILSEKVKYYPNDFQNYVEEWLQMQTSCVKINNNYSNTFTIEKGLPQGDPLSPLLFNIYIDDIFEQLEENTKCILFADDIIIYGNKYMNVKKTTLNFEKFINNELKMKFNRNKTEYLNFKENGKSSKQKFCWNNMKIYPSDYIKYLGIEIGKDFKKKK